METQSLDFPKTITNNLIYIINHISQYMRGALHWFPFPHIIHDCVLHVTVFNRLGTFLPERALPLFPHAQDALLSIVTWLSYSPDRQQCRIAESFLLFGWSNNLEKDFLQMAIHHLPQIELVLSSTS